MSKKVFTFLLLAVFVLTQFSAVSAAPQPFAVVVTFPAITNAPFAHDTDTNIPITWSYHDAAAVPAAKNQYVLLYTSMTSATYIFTPSATQTCTIIATYPTGTPSGFRSGTFNIPVAGLSTTAPVSGGIYYFSLTVEEGTNVGAPPATCAAIPGIVAVPVGNMSQVTFAAKLSAYTTTLAALPAFSQEISANLVWSVNGPAAPAGTLVYAWARKAGGAFVACRNIATLATGATSVSSTYSFIYNDPAFAAFPYMNFSAADQDDIEFAITVEQAPVTAALANCNTAAKSPPVATTKLAGTFIDASKPKAITMLPPNKTAVVAPLTPNTQTVACNTFELWGLGTDVVPGTGKGYSGLKSWNDARTGPLAVPVPLGTAPVIYTLPNTKFPASAFGSWTFKVTPIDAAGNSAGTFSFREIAASPTATELADCKSFTDVAGNANEVQIRYLGTLGIITGNADGTYKPEGTLSRAEAATLFVKANGTALASSPILGCSFSDVAATDWFAKYVWTACQAKIMIGRADGTFAPVAKFSRGDAVTVLNQIATGVVTTGSGYFAKQTDGYVTVLNSGTTLWLNPTPYRSLLWTDIFPGAQAYYAAAVNYAYQSGVAEATSIDSADSTKGTFSPDQAVTRGDFAKMLYRALSRINN